MMTMEWDNDDGMFQEIIMLNKTTCKPAKT